MQIGDTVQFDRNSWRISGRFQAEGSAFESEVWCRLEDMQSALKRQDLSLVAAKLEPGGSTSDVEMFCSERLDWN